MFTIMGGRDRLCDGLSRRSFLQAGVLGGLTLPNLLRAQAGSGRPPRSAILVYLAGGPSHFETFDPKPDAPVEIRGPYRSIATKVVGLRISETMPRLAAIADQYSIIRSCAHDNAGHGGGNRYVHTGYQSASPEFELPHDFPVLGSIVSKVRGTTSGGMPTFVRCPQAPDGDAAFLGNAYNPFNVYSTGLPIGVALQPIVPIARIEERRTLRNAFDTMARVGDQQLRMNAMDGLEQQALDMISSPRARQALDPNREPASVRERYGNYSAGKSMLLARRLIEAGTSIVSVRIGSWDHHGSAGGTVVVGTEENVPPLDQALSALIVDLEQRGMLDDTVVWCWGEFGRTPRVNQTGGRDHWPQAMSVLMAGGGLQKGHVIGATNHRGEHPTQRPLTPADILATVYQQLGIDYRRAFHASGNRPIQILNHGEPISELIA